jgi:translation elongation factor EF-G
MGAMKDACKESFLGANPRIVEGVFKCEVLADSKQYGKIY